jgi:hypothetical protein
VNFVDRIQELQRFCREAKRPISRITVAVSEKYARRTLGLPSDAALIYNGVPLRCIGSKAWRARQAESVGGGRRERTKSNLRRLREAHNVAEAHL